MLGNSGSMCLISRHCFIIRVVAAAVCFFGAGVDPAVALDTVRLFDGGIRTFPTLEAGLIEGAPAARLDTDSVTSDIGPGPSLGVGNKLPVVRSLVGNTASLTDIPGRGYRVAGKKDLRGTLLPHRSSLTAVESITLGSVGSYNRSSMDFFLPLDLGCLGTLFGQAHWEIEDPFRQSASSSSRRMDLAVGTGLRRMIGKSWLLGLNWFHDATNLEGHWQASSGLGFESVMAFRESHSFDTSFNIYQGGGVDAEIGYTCPILFDHLDLRISAAKYRFFDGRYILGWRTGLDLASPDRTFAVQYEYGQDSRDPSYHSISCSVSVAFQFENLLSGKSPFLKPEPLYPGRRKLDRQLSNRVKRHWSQPGTVVARRNTPAGEHWTTPGRMLGTPLKYFPDDPPPGATPGEPDYAWPWLTTIALLDGDRIWNWKPFKPFVFPFKVGFLSYLVSDTAYRWCFGPYEPDPKESNRSTPPSR
ncbi:inverse autotransporter beta domain-containing protein [Thermodesulfobacteriota bacterium]